jgi:hypothetical protein
MSTETTAGDKNTGTRVESSRERHCERCGDSQPARELPRSDRAACSECGLILDDGDKPDSEALRLVDGCEYKSLGGGAQ